MLNLGESKHTFVSVLTFMSGSLEKHHCLVKFIFVCCRVMQERRWESMDREQGPSPSYNNKGQMTLFMPETYQFLLLRKSKTFYFMQATCADERTYLKEHALSFIPINHFACSCKTNCS